MLRATKGQIDAATDCVYPAGKNSSFVHLMKEERLPHLPYEREGECSFYLVSGAIEEPYGTRSIKWPQPHLRLTLNSLDGRAFFMMPRAPTIIIKWAITCLCLRSPNQFHAASYESGLATTPTSRRGERWEERSECGRMEVSEAAGPFP